MNGDMKRIQGLTFARQEIDEALAACAWALEAIESSVTIERLVAEQYQDAAVTASAKVMRERQELAESVRKAVDDLNAGHDARDIDPLLMEGAGYACNPGHIHSWLTWSTRPDSMVF